MEQQKILEAATRALVKQGLTQHAAQAAVSATTSHQSSEWSRIVARAERGDLSRVYIVVTHKGENDKAALVYAPAERDNIQHVMEFAGQGPDEGGGPDDQQMDAEPTYSYYPVTVYDVSGEIKSERRAYGRA